MNIFITGGAGFIGVHTANYYLSRGNKVTIFDNFSRKGTKENVNWLKQKYDNKKLNVVEGDIRDFNILKRSIPDHDVIIHLAGQVAVTTSVANPREDFEINALGTFNVLEAVRLLTPNSILLFASTNKVYGGMEEIKIIKDNNRYKYQDLPNGIPETQNLDMHSPYGVSKGCADQYVRDYYRIYGLKTVVFRQSCLAANQEIVTPFGKKPVALIKPGDLVQSGTGWTLVKKIWKTGIKPVRKLTTMHGLSVTLTEDHKITRPNGLQPNKNLEYGDFLAVLPETLFIPRLEIIPDSVLDPEKYINTVKSRTLDTRCINEAKQISSKLLPLKGEKLLAVTEIVGRLFGDGHLGKHQRQNRSTPSYTVQHFGIKNELEEVKERLNWLGIPASGIISWNSTSNPSGKHLIEGTSQRIQQQSLPVFTLFELLGVPVGDKVRIEYKLPTWVRYGHGLIKRAFLRGFFGAELTKVNANSYIAPSFAQSKDKRYLKNGRLFMRELQNLLKEFNIYTSYFEAEPVKFKKGETVQMTVRLLGGNSLFPKLASIGYAFSKNRSYHLNALLRWTWEQTGVEHSKEVEKRYHVDGELFWDSLDTVETLSKQAVYDIEVEDAKHLFIAGGIQVSNCIYGTHQFGIEDQGWVSWFTIAAVLEKPITVYGDGMQVRDVLFVEDLVNAYDLAIQYIKVRPPRSLLRGNSQSIRPKPRTESPIVKPIHSPTNDGELSGAGVAAGQIYNVGGGPKFTLSLLELLDLLEKKLGKKIPFTFSGWRPGDQPVYVSNIAKIKKHLNWQPQIDVQNGTSRMIDWIIKEKDLINKVLL